MADNTEEAARWFAAERRGLMAHDERQDYERWLAVPANEAALAALRALWRELDVVAPAMTGSAPRPQASRTQVAAMVGLVSLTLAMVIRLDGGWWSALDWWSR